MKIFGIDQTGALKNKTEAKPLPASELVFDKNFRLCDIQSFHIKHLGDWVSSLDANIQTHVFTDCVFGLPLPELFQSETFYLRDWIKSAGDFTFNQQNYGLKTSEAFFAEIRAHYKIKSNDYPLRFIEKHLKSNSVFTTQPYQKNIQTGTFRIWKELAPVLDQLLIWPFETDSNFTEEIKINFYEVYPTYFYKKYFGAQKRNFKDIYDFTQKNLDFKMNEKEILNYKNPDLCDSLAAALGGYLTLKNKKSQVSHLPDSIFFEGWIYGADL